MINCRGRKISRTPCNDKFGKFGAELMGAKLWYSSRDL